MNIGWGTSPTFPYVHFFEKQFFRNITTDAVNGLRPYSSQYSISLTAGVNQPLSFKTSAAMTTNAFTNVDVFITYYVIDFS